LFVDHVLTPIEPGRFSHRPRHRVRVVSRTTTRCTDRSTGTFQFRRFGGVPGGQIAARSTGLLPRLPRVTTGRLLGWRVRAPLRTDRGSLRNSSPSRTPPCDLDFFNRAVHAGDGRWKGLTPPPSRGLGESLHTDMSPDRKVFAQKYRAHRKSPVRAAKHPRSAETGPERISCALPVRSSTTPKAAVRTSAA
jgi:hypothetical protein